MLYVGNLEIVWNTYYIHLIVSLSLYHNLHYIQNKIQFYTVIDVVVQHIYTYIIGYNAGDTLYEAK